MSNELTNNPTQRLRAFDAVIRAAVDGAMRDYYSPLRPDETLDDRSELIHDELWSALARALVIHAQPHATPETTHAAILDYVAACIGSAQAVPS